MNETIQVLDHGYVRLIETYGSDMRIIEAARMSTDKGFLGWEPVYAYKCNSCIYTCELDQQRYVPNCPNCHSIMALDETKSHKGDKKLLAFLYNHKHMTPFEMGGMIIEVQAPIFVFREWHRHRTQSYNEMSARYIPLPDVNYIPTVERLMMTSSTNKQAQGIGKQLTEEDASMFLRALDASYKQAQATYEAGLAWGVPKELARLPVPVGRYSRMRASTNLRNWLAFLTLRMDTDAQWEIRQYANIVATLIADKFPRTYELFVGGAK